MNLNAMWVRNRTTKTNGISYILQKAGIAVLTEDGLRQIRESIEHYKENARVLMRALDECGIRYWGGKNAPYIWMSCPKGMKSWDFFDLMLNEIQVIGTPGEGFGEAGEGFFRLSSFGNPEDTKIAVFFTDHQDLLVRRQIQSSVKSADSYSHYDCIISQMFCHDNLLLFRKLQHAGQSLSCSIGLIDRHTGLIFAGLQYM